MSAWIALFVSIRVDTLQRLLLAYDDPIVAVKLPCWAYVGGCTGSIAVPSMLFNFVLIPFRIKSIMTGLLHFCGSYRVL